MPAGMDNDAVAAAIVQWAVALLPELQGSYDHPVPGREFPLPDVMVVITNDRTVSGGARVQQTMLRMRDVQVIFAVDPSDPAAASSLVQSIADRCTAAIIADRTLGGHLTPGGVLNDESNPIVAFSFEPPFVTFDDETEARQTTARMVVAEPVPARTPSTPF